MEMILSWQIWRMRCKSHFDSGQHDEWKRMTISIYGLSEAVLCLLTPFVTASTWMIEPLQSRLRYENIGRVIRMTKELALSQSI
jgi:hypothetical protein